MNHQEALHLQAVEKYILGELTPELREQFEEHYFDCSECSTELKSLGTFVTASRLVFKDEERSFRMGPHAVGAERPSWFNWLQPVISVPAIMALAAVVVYQLTMPIRSARKQEAVQTVAEVYESSYHLQGATRGGETSKLAVRTEENFGLDFDFVPTRIYPSYKGRLLDSSGQAVLRFSLKGAQRNKEVHLVIPGGKVRAGSYDLVVVGENGTTNQDTKDGEVLRLSFLVVSEPEVHQSGEHPNPPKE
ncbi:MAG TPA: zf-HC2 domain-containing protein [Candidatus Acidoferrum sp.]|nr:zf-HC2 domain-containing protein [Candidatus Acidoferrum sp.]